MCCYIFFQHSCQQKISHFSVVLLIFVFLCGCETRQLFQRCVSWVAYKKARTQFNNGEFHCFTDQLIQRAGFRTSWVQQQGCLWLCLPPRLVSKLCHPTGTNGCSRQPNGGSNASVRWEQCERPSSDTWINKMWDIVQPYQRRKF